MKRVARLVGHLLFIGMVCAPMSAQKESKKSDQQDCQEPFYQRKDVTQLPTIKSKPAPELSEYARMQTVRGRVVLGVVLCDNGKVTNIKVKEGLPYGITKAAIVAARKIKFTPAEKDGQAVAFKLQVEYNFNIN